MDLLAARLPDEQRFYNDLAKLTWTVIDTMFSDKVVKPGVSRTSDLVWYFRQAVNDMGLGTWFQPSVDVQRKGATDEQFGDDPIIERGDVLHCDVGITALRLNTDIQHLAYVLQEGERDAPDGLKQALARSNRMQDILLEEIRPGRTGNEILASSACAPGERRYRRHHLLAPDRAARARVGTADRALGLSGRRARAGRPQGDPDDVVLDRAPGHLGDPRVERAAGANAAGGGHGDGAGRRAAVGISAPDGATPHSRSSER